MYCFPNEKDKRDINFSGISDQIWEQNALKKADPEMFLFYG